MIPDFLTRSVIGATLALAVSATAATAATYTFSATGVDGDGTIDFVIETLDFVGNDSFESGAIDSCTLTTGIGATCDRVVFDAVGANFGDDQFPVMIVSGVDEDGTFAYNFFFLPESFSTLGDHSPMDPTAFYGVGSASYTAVLTVSAPAVVPLPASLPLLLAGLGAFAILRRTRRPA